VSEKILSYVILRFLDLDLSLQCVRRVSLSFSFVSLTASLLHPFPTHPMADKLQTLQTELSHLRLTSKHLETSNASLETRLIELTDQLEMVTLDKEFAEEKGENLESELEGEKEKVLELEVEVDVLRGQNGELALCFGVGCGLRERRKRRELTRVCFGIRVRASNS